MKKLYSLFALIALLFATSGCEDDYRSMVLFEGVEPIYQIGTCDNLVSFLSFYLSETEGETVLGIDGGDGSYRVINEHESVASVTFTDDVNGYQRIKIHPLAEGETIVKVMDGSGESTQLRITVRSRRQYTMTKMGFEYGISDGAPTELLARCLRSFPIVPGWRIPDIMYWCRIRNAPIFWRKVYWKSTGRGKRTSLLWDVMTRFRWKMRTEIHTHCGSLPVMESRGSLHGLSRGMKVAVWLNVYLQKM